MSNEKETTTTAVAVMNNSNKQVMTFQEMERLAAYAEKSNNYGMKQADAFCLMQIAMARGKPPVMALLEYDIIMGKPAMKAAAMQANYEAAGGLVEIVVNTPDEVRLKLSFPGKQPQEFSWTKKDADEYMVYAEGKTIPISQKSNWRGDKKRQTMLYYRALAEGVRRMAPGTFMGIYTPDETEEIQEENKYSRVAHVDSVSNASGSGASETFSGIAVMTDEQKNYLVDFAGGKAKLLAAARKHFDNQGLKLTDLTFPQAEELIAAAKRIQEKRNVEESKPDKQPEQAAKSHKAEQEEIDIDAPDDFGGDPLDPDGANYTG